MQLNGSTQRCGPTARIVTSSVIVKVDYYGGFIFKNSVPLFVGQCATGGILLRRWEKLAGFENCSKNQKLERIQGSRVKAETENGLVLLGHCGGGGGNVRL